LKGLHLSLLILLLASGVAIAQTPCENGMSGIYPCDEFELYAFLPLEEVGGGVKGNDCWGWVDDMSGREFVLFGRTNGMAVVEISDPESPIYLAEVPPNALTAIWRDIKVIGNYAFIVSDVEGHGMQVLELTQLLNIEDFVPDLPLVTIYEGFGAAHNIVANTETEYVYGVGTDTFGGGLHAVDVSDPTQPEIAGSFEGIDIHDAQAVIYSGLDSDYLSTEIVFCFAGDNISIVNAADKSDMQLISSILIPTSEYIHQGWVSEDHRFLYINDELDEINTGVLTRTYIIDIEDLDNPIYLGNHDYGTQSTDHNLYSHNGLLYASNNSSGIRVSKILEDGSLEYYGYFDTYPLNNESGYTGSWSVYPYFPSGTIAISNRDGLILIKKGPSGINVPELSVSNSLLIYPNPVSSFLKIKGDFKNCDVVLYNPEGKELFRVEHVVLIDDFIVDVSTFNKGAYVLKLEDPITGELLVSQRFVKTN
jgi:choice-of-anchor B domain-containing protein